jgi:hypothetical protein
MGSFSYIEYINKYGFHAEPLWEHIHMYIYMNVQTQAAPPYTFVFNRSTHNYGLWQPLPVKISYEGKRFFFNRVLQGGIVKDEECMSLLSRFCIFSNLVLFYTSWQVAQLYACLQV